MKRRGGDLVVRALEDEGARWTFGIPGTHNIELYDALERSEKITPVLVTDEQSASFMADAVSRTSTTVGVVNVVPGAGVTHCLSGVAEALMDGVPLVVLACGIRRDTGRAFQLHDVDQGAILKPVVKAFLRPEKPEDIYPTVRQAFALARGGTPGPVAVEIPAEFYFLTQDVPEPRYDAPAPAPTAVSASGLESAARLLSAAKNPALYVGNGARGSAAGLVALAEKLGAPVCTTISGKGVFPESHPLWLWNGFGKMAPPFVREIMDRCDALLAIGCRFGEVATASYGLTPPENLIHVDVNPAVFNCNYPAKLAIEADAAAFVSALLPRLKSAANAEPLKSEIARGHAGVNAERSTPPQAAKVTPAAFFKALQKAAGPDAIYVADSGNGTFLAMEHLRLDAPGCFIAPIDFSCMGYAVPAAVGAKFANPETPVVALAGDGALLMTGLELLTAARYGVAPVVCVLRDRELGQIAQFQRTSLDRDTCTVLHPYELKAFAAAVNARFLPLKSDAALDDILPRAMAAAREGVPVVVEVEIDYGEKTYFTRGAVAANFWRLPLAERARMIARVVGRKLSSALGASGGR